MLSRLAIVNRGEPALRLIRAVRQLNEEGRQDITVIALHTEAEQRALFVRAADEAVRLRDDVSSGSPYLDHDELERALRLSRADAVWVGWGFVAEDPSFADLCERLGLTFIGPPAQAMRQLGDKIEAKLLAEKTGVPVAPWSGGPVRDVEEAAPPRGVDRIPAHAQGPQRWGWSWHPDGAVARGAWRLPSSARGPRPRRRSAIRWSSWRAWSSVVGTSRCRSLRTRTGRCGRRAFATAPSSGATRS